MTSPDPAFASIPETVILDMQSSLYRRKDALGVARKEAEAAQARADELRRVVRRQELELSEVAQFLTAHNCEASSDWFADAGVQRPEPASE